MSNEVGFSQLCNFSDKQVTASHTVDQHQYTLFGGSRGPGKSYWLRWNLLRELLRLAGQGVDGAVVGLFCEDYPSLKDRQISKIQVEFPQWMGAIRDSKSHGLGFHLRPEYGGGVLALRNLDDASKYQSAEFAAIGVDELTKHLKDTFDLLRGSLRWPGVARPRFMAATNPGSIGHGWVKQIWIDRDFPPEMLPLADEFAFVRALPDDNPHLDKSYWEMLETLPSELARAWRWGDWDVFAGQYFKDLRRDIHGYTGATPGGRTFICLDYGEVDPCAVYWCRTDINGDVWVYRELYAGLQYEELKARINELSAGEHIDYVVIPPDIYAKSKGTGVVGAEVLASNPGALPIVKADNNRVEGWRHMKRWITTGRLHVHLDACPNFWRTVPALVHDDKNVEDLDGRGEDHCADSMRYGLMSRPQVPTAAPAPINDNPRVLPTRAERMAAKPETEEYL
jgi:phage terminase large subunit